MTKFALKDSKICIYQNQNISVPIIWSTENVQKVQMLWGFEKRHSEIGQNALTVALFEQQPQAQIRTTSKYICAHQIANDKTIILSTENVQRVHSRPKLWGFEKRHCKIG